MEAIAFAQILAEAFSFKWPGYCYGVPGGKQGTVGKEKANPCSLDPVVGKNEMPSIQRVLSET